MIKRPKIDLIKLYQKLLLVSFILMISSLLLVVLKGNLVAKDQNTKPKDIPVRVLAANDIEIVEEKELAHYPKLVEEAEFPLVSARSVMAIDLDSGISLYEKRSRY